MTDATIEATASVAASAEKEGVAVSASAEKEGVEVSANAEKEGVEVSASAEKEGVVASTEALIGIGETVTGTAVVERVAVLIGMNAVEAAVETDTSVGEVMSAVRGGHLTEKVR